MPCPMVHPLGLGLPPEARALQGENSPSPGPFIQSTPPPFQQPSTGKKVGVQGEQP